MEPSPPGPLSDTLSLEVPTAVPDLSPDPTLLTLSSLPPEDQHLLVAMDIDPNAPFRCVWSCSCTDAGYVSTSRPGENLKSRARTAQRKHAAHRLGLPFALIKQRDAALL